MSLTGLSNVCPFLRYKKNEILVSKMKMNDTNKLNNALKGKKRLFIIKAFDTSIKCTRGR
jgi:hypothetical protein